MPKGYHEHLVVLEEVLGKQRAPYYGPTMYYPHEAIRLWEGNRSIEEYAAEAFQVEERANGQTWMGDGDDDGEDGMTEDGCGTSAVGTPLSSAAMTPGSVPERTSLSYFMGV